MVQEIPWGWACFLHPQDDSPAYKALDSCLNCSQATCTGPGTASGTLHKEVAENCALSLVDSW